MDYQAVILDFGRKSVKYVQLPQAIRAAEKHKPAKVTAGGSTPPAGRRRRKR